MAERGASEPARESKLAEHVVILAHDLKNSLAALSANLHFLEGVLADTADGDSLEALGDSVMICQSLDHLLRNLDLLGRSEKLLVHRHLTSLRSVAGDISNRFQRQARSAGVELEIIADPESDDVLAFIDRDLFTRSAENLLANAIEHAPRGSLVRILIAGGGGESSLTIVDARENMPAPRSPHATGAPGEAPAEVRQGRGLGLVCAEVAARAAGSRLERGGGPGDCRLRLVAPARE